MPSKIYQLLALKRLYLKRMCGECFTHIDSIPLSNKYTKLSGSVDIQEMLAGCNMCVRSKLTTKRIVGFFNPQCLVCFITQNPLVESKQNKPIFFSNKSAQMLQNMILHVFKISYEKCCIFSLVKCPIESTPHIDEVSACIDFLYMQLEKISPKVIVLFGEECAKYLLGQNIKATTDYGRILWHNNQSFLLTHSLGEIVRNPSLKPQVMQHLLVAKGVL